VTKFCLPNIEINFEKGQMPRSFDAVVVVLFSSRKIILVKNKERAWEFPGGHREGNETFEQTVVREAYEEAGVIITNIEYLGYYKSRIDKITAIASADVAAYEKTSDTNETFHVGLFNTLPKNLSFGDGREQLILELAIASRQKKWPDNQNN
jgi:8-oxo-dGTP diphosphatase